MIIFYAQNFMKIRVSGLTLLTLTFLNILGVLEFEFDF